MSSTDGDIVLTDVPDGTKVMCSIGEVGPIIAIVTLEDSEVFLCQDYVNGSTCGDLKGMRHSWSVGSGSIKHLLHNNTEVYELRKPGDDGYADFERYWKVKRVIAKVKNLNKSPLIFMASSGPMFINADSVHTFVLQTIQLMNGFDSVTTTLKIVRSRNSDFTVETVWRHLLYFCPDISIYTVMEIVYNETAQNSVLRQSVRDGTRYFTTSLVGAHRFSLPLRTEIVDEFGLGFDDWSRISSIVEDRDG